MLCTHLIEKKTYHKTARAPSQYSGGTKPPEEDQPCCCLGSHPEHNVKIIPKAGHVGIIYFLSSVSYNPPVAKDDRLREQKTRLLHHVSLCMETMESCPEPPPL